MIAQFALRLACGMSLTWVLLPRDRITSGFFRIQMLVALGLWALAAVAMSTPPGWGESATPGAVTAARILAAAGAATAYAGSIAWTLERRRAGTLFIYVLAGLSTALVAWTSVTAAAGTTRGALTIFSELASAFLMGSATSGMLLGHWYLTAPTMTIDPLARANACFAGAALLRLAAAAAGLALAWPSLTAGTAALWLWLHWTAGIAGPLVLALMVWRILRYRNTQAATGVLFVGVIVSFIGELSATLASRELQFPL
jgi:hypothetical protein